MVTLKKKKKDKRKFLPKTTEKLTLVLNFFVTFQIVQWCLSNAAAKQFGG